VLRKYRVAESGSRAALDHFRVIGFREHARRDTVLREKLADDQAHVASFGIEQKSDFREFRSSHGTDMSVAHFVCRRAHDEQLFVKERNAAKVGLGNRERDER
jgi:hypothetical protein